MSKHVVVVESPAKAKTINKYLGSDYEVIASFGHVRDLPPKNGSVDPDNDFTMLWQVDGRGKKQLDLIAKACHGAKSVYLATDPDREGEAISWHIYDELDKRKKLGDKDIYRVVFNEITKKAVEKAFAQPRDLNQDLVDAYLARRALDYLFGFNLSPVLWRKLPGAKSAGRVQSVALRLICDRESEIEAFRAKEYWSLPTLLKNENGEDVAAKISIIDGKKAGKFAITNEEQAQALAKRIKASDFKITSIESKDTRRNPAAPFTTSTLQQEASRKFYMNTSRTMQLAQKLYEGISMGGETVGLITYMRTDSPALSGDVIASARDFIDQSYGNSYLPKSPRVYKTKSKNAQEAHEAIRPVDIGKTPERMARYLDADMLKLYSLIWKRTIASQMESAVFDQVIVDMMNGDNQLGLRATGLTQKFDGFLRLYQEGVDDKDEDDDDTNRLPPLKENEVLTTISATPKQHFTQPPPRYGEASLVKEMEALGIGRPSTYASVLKLLQDRDYVRLEKRRFEPEERGRLVTAFLTGFFEKYVDFDFTAGMETALDEISNGDRSWRVVLREFWQDFVKHTKDASELNFQDVRKVLDEALKDHYFVADDEEAQEKLRACPACKTGRLELNFGRYGIYLSCSNYPECAFKRSSPMGQVGDEKGDGSAVANDLILPKDLGLDPEKGTMVSLREGPYGFYVQRELPAQQIEDEPSTKGKKAKKQPKPPKPDRVGLPKGMTPQSVTLPMAISLLSLPREVGQHPESGDMIEAGLGRYGPFLRYQGKYTSLAKDDDVLSIGLNRAVVVLAEKQEKSGGNAQSLGTHPDGGDITTGKGRFGPYVKWKRIYASIPKSMEPEDIDLETAIELITAKNAKTAGKATVKKAPVKKATAKKTAKRKTSTKS